MNDFLKISKCDSLTKIENLSAFTLMLYEIPIYPKRRWILKLVIEKKSFHLIEYDVDFKKIYITFK